METARLGIGQQGRLDGEVPVEDFFPERSFYARHGDWLGTFCMAEVAIMAALALAGDRLKA